jgi:hypothetical protein
VFPGIRWGIPGTRLVGEKDVSSGKVRIGTRDTSEFASDRVAMG